MADRIQIIIESLLKSNSKQAIEAELKKIEKQLKPMEVKMGISQEAEIKLFKSMQKIEQQNAKMNTNQEKAIQKELANKEKQLQYEQKVRQQIAEQELKQQQRLVDLQSRSSNSLYQQKMKETSTSYNLGTVVDAPSYVSKSQSSFEKYMQSVKGTSAEVTKFNSHMSRTGEIITTANTRVKEGSDKWRNYQTTINQTTGVMHELDRGTTDVINRQLSLSKMITTAVSKMLLWTVAGTALFGTIHTFKDMISTVSELDNSLNQIRITTGKSQEEVSRLGLAYNKLAKDMSVTTKEVADTSVELYRQGLSQEDVDKRMQSIIKYAKVSSISLKQANEIVTASANATKADVNEIIDVMSYLGDASASGKMCAPLFSNK